MRSRVARTNPARCAAVSEPSVAPLGPAEATADLCAQDERCRFDPRCPFADLCALHVHGPDCGGCLE